MSHQKPPPPSDDEAQDAWLKGALLHAPDAHADAPPALTHNILREARLALEADQAALGELGAAQAGSTQPRHWLIAAWDQLTRPAVAAGFASLMVATLAGMLWWDKPLDERGDPPMVASAPAAATQTPQLEVAPAPDAVRGPLSAHPANGARASTQALQTQPSRRSASELAANKDSLSSAAEPKMKRAEAPATSPKTAEPSLIQKPERPIEREAKREATPPNAAVASASASASANASAITSANASANASAITPAPAPVAPPPAPPPAPAPMAIFPETASPKVGRKASAALADAVQNRSASAQQSVRAAPASNALAASPVSPLLAALANAPERWRWQADGGAPQAVTPALQSWLQLLERSAGSRWVVLSLSAAVDDANGAPPRELLITYTDGNSMRIVLAGNTVTLQRGGAATTVSANVLAPAAAEALRQAWADKLR